MFHQILRATGCRQQCHRFVFNIPENCHPFVGTSHLGAMLTNETQFLPALPRNRPLLSSSSAFINNLR